MVLQVNFPMRGPWGAEMAEAFRGLAESINTEPGFLWKVWIEDESAGRSGGIYLFDTRENAEAYVAMHTERLAGFGITEVSATFSDVNEPLSTLNRARLP
ncbi:monooxygenase [Dietzia cinnamea]|uniref:Putative monooxygenase ydhR n=1 Tax=Dietzia cinnamea TaxID=321318 RepID=A0A4R3ZVM9_9ACTN|nr:monooxygenase [Dietzia cinnamea]TCW24611.1 putative monooxygenase ydhR [Dietzia cinnamea]